VDDDALAIRGVIARSFALLGASVHAKDPADQIEIARGYEHWILNGEYPPPIHDPATLAMLQGYCIKFRARRKQGK
jgi:hypothetical protein